MSAIRNLFLRVLFDPDFATAISECPDRALADYDLSEEERAALTKPAADLFRFLGPSSGDNEWGDWHRPPPTITAGHVFAITALAQLFTPDGDLERLRPILSAIKASGGPARYDLIRTLVSELTREP